VGGKTTPATESWRDGRAPDAGAGGVIARRGDQHALRLIDLIA
jgi:hypothetical protein